jgi:hypothetical protein
VCVSVEQRLTFVDNDQLCACAQRFGRHIRGRGDDETGTCREKEIALP